MNASKAAQLVRRAIAKSGGRPKGKVRVEQTDYTTEVSVWMTALNVIQQESVSEAIEGIGNSPSFSWNCH